MGRTQQSTQPQPEQTMTAEEEWFLREQVLGLEAEIAEIKASETWRIGSTLVSPVAPLVHWWRHNKPVQTPGSRSNTGSTAAATPVARRHPGLGVVPEPYGVSFCGDINRFRRKVRAVGRVALVASWGSRNRRPYCFQVEQMRALSDAGWAVVFAHAAGPDETLIESADAIAGVDCLVKRPNMGYDFGSWSAALRVLAETMTVAMSDVDEVLLVNDSNFGTIKGLTGLATSPGKQFLCATDSFERTYHAQSYLTLFGRDVIRSGVLSEFLDSAAACTDKHTAIEQGELRLTSFMHDAGFDLHPVSPYEQVAETWLTNVPKTLSEVKEVYNRVSAHGASGHVAHIDRIVHLAELVADNKPVNPSHVFWRTLVRDYSHTLVKRELLTRNPARIGDLALAWHTDTLAGVADPVHLRELAATTGGTGPFLMFNNTTNNTAKEAAAS